MTVRILLADDHPLIRAGVQSVLSRASDFILVGEATNGDEAQEMGLVLQPDILILDLSMPGLSADEVVGSFKSANSDLKIIILTAYKDDVRIRNLIALNVSGYVLKDEMPESLLRAIEAFMQGDSWFSKEIVQSLVQEKETKGVSEEQIHLTPREMDVLLLIAVGKTDLEIGEELRLSKSTVRSHVQSILEKFECENRVQATYKALKKGMLVNIL